MCFISSQSTFSSLFTDKKSSPKKIVLTPLIDKILRNKELSISSLLVISNDLSIDTFLPGINLSEFGLGVISV